MRVLLAGTVIAGLVGAALAPAPVLAAPRKPAATAKPAPAAKPSPVATPAAPSPTPTAAPAARPSMVVALSLDLKDPYTAYSLGLIPFGSTIAARYVGTRRLSWRIDDELNGAATRQALMDWGLLVGGAGILGLAAAMPYGSQSQTAFLGAAALLAIPFTHWAMYAPFWGEQAVGHNRAELTRHGFPLDEAAPAPLILAPTE